MLARVAERLYWMGRYIERVENIARLINVNTNLLLDLPRGTKIGWLNLVDIVGGNDEFQQQNIKNDEQAIARFLITDTTHHVSILNSLRYARENARTSREIIPTEAWELINNLYIFVKENASKSTSRAARNRLLIHVIEKTQQYTGLLAGTMSHTNAYDFIRLGRNLERSDMTTRIVDVGTVNLITNREKGEQAGDSLEPFINILWMSVLQSLSAYQMYRQHVLDRVNGVDVVTFLLQDVNFPRAVCSCFTNLKACLDKLPNNEDAFRAMGAAQRRIDNADIEKILGAGTLHEFIDSIQLDIASIHNEIARAWFLARIPSQVQSG